MYRGAKLQRLHKANEIDRPASDGRTGFEIEKTELGNVDRDVNHAAGFYSLEPLSKRPTMIDRLWFV